MQGRHKPMLQGLLLILSLISSCPVVAAETSTLPSPVTIPGGSGNQGMIWGECNGNDLASASNQVQQMSQQAANDQKIIDQLANVNNALNTRLQGNADTTIAALTGAIKSLQSKLAEMYGLLQSDLENLNNNRLNAKVDCNGYGAATANTNAPSGYSGNVGRVSSAIDQLWRDTKTGSLSQATGNMVNTLLNSSALKDHPVFNADWLLPANFLIASDDATRSTLMIAALTNPALMPKVAATVKNTPSGQRAAALAKIKSAQTALAERALAVAVQPFQPDPNFVQIVPQNQSDAGVPEAERFTPAQDGSYSRMQYYRSTQQYLAGNMNLKREIDQDVIGGVLKHLVRVLSEQYLLDVDRFNNELHQTAVLAALLGSFTEKQQEKAAQFLAPLRTTSAAQE